MAHTANGDVGYSIPEEIKRGSVIGNIAKDLGLDVNRLSSRKARIDTEGNRKRYCDINLNNGDLTVADRIDREALCKERPSCVLNFELVLEHPLEIHNVGIQIQDINDNTPTFSKDILYPSLDGNSFMTEMVPKAAQAGSLVSKVIAVDADSGQNAWLSYHIIKASDPGLFTIGVHSGEIRTQRDLSESDSMKQNLIVSVRDNGQPSLSATCALYLLISDNLAEVPELKDMSHDESSSKLTFYLIIALVSVSTFFLTFIIIILAVRFCRRRKPRLLFDGAVAIPSAYLPPNYAEVEGAGTLRSTYNYDAYLTTGSRTSDFKFVRSYNEGTLTSDMTLRKTQSAVDDLEGLDADINDSLQVR
ncbi:putative protocadherin-3-like, partial [Triplophysa rosa]